MCCPQFALNLELEFDNDPGKFGGSTENRKCTDVFALILVVLFFGTVVALTAYCISKSDVEKITNGYDDCGNVCGRNNKKTSSITYECFGTNMEEKKYIQIKEDEVNGTIKECVSVCSVPDIKSKYCVSQDKHIPYSFSLLKSWKYGLCIIVVSAVYIFLLTRIYIFFVYLPAFYINSFTFLIFFNLSSCLVYTIYSYVVSDKRSKTYLFIIIALAIFIILYLIFYFQNILKTYFSIQLVLESKLAFAEMPFLWLQPIFSSFVVSVCLLIVIYCCIWVRTFSYLDQSNSSPSDTSNIDYVPYPIAIVTEVFLIYAMLLFYEIVKNCQCMVIGGCAAQWYFTKRAGRVSQPVSRTIKNLLRYHLGTICWGSILLNVTYVLRPVLNVVKGASSGYNRESVYTCSCHVLSETALSPLQTCSDCITQNGFIMTAMYGCSYCAGSIRAHKLLTQNCFNAAALCRFADFFFLLGKHSVTLILFAIVALLNMFDYSKKTIILIIGAEVVLWIMIDFFYSAIGVMLDTFLLCFCEDVEYESGPSKPYYMSTNLAQFVENANKLLDPVKWRNVDDQWDKGPKRIYSHENFFEKNAANLRR